jgi:hypothetical protein
LSGKATYEPSTRVLPKEVTSIDHCIPVLAIEGERVGRGILTCGEVVKLVTLEAQSLLISEEVGIVERGLIHELKRLGDEEHREDNKIELPSEFLGL